MDKETLSNYGWIVICVLVLAVMIALATPFGNFICDAIWSTANGLFNTNNNALDNTLEDLGVVPTPEQLQARYKFEYYSTLNGAVNDVNNGTIGTNADANKEDAVAGIYTNAGQTYVVLLKDTTEATVVQPSVDMTINLGGHTLSANDDYGIKVLGGNVKIDGRLTGSSIEISRSTGNYAMAIWIESSANTIVDGGIYIGEYIGSNINLAIYNRGTATFSNCDIVGISSDGTAAGVQNNGTATFDNCNIKGYANYTYGDVSYYGSSSIGIVNQNVLTLNDCYAMGTHSGITNRGALYINGGIYEGYGHGGIYFSNINAPAYVCNATIRECQMPDGYTVTAGDNNAGFYIGGSAGKDNIVVYMDNCDIYGSVQPIVLRGSDGEQNNSLYISNSRINTERNIRIDNNTHRLYIGVGNNFTVDNTTLPSAVVTTNETYTQK